jgi:ATP-dependent Clp protease ATP-binding subunit ClpB
VAELQYGRLPELEKKLAGRAGEGAAARTRRRKAGGKPQLLRTLVGAEEIAEVVARATGIPVAKLMQGERDKLLQMEQAARARGRPGRGHRGGRECDPPLTRGLV